jgi:hypothetical protein
LFPNMPLLRRSAEVLEAAKSKGYDVVVGEIAVINQTAATVREWLATSSWEDSQKYLEAHHGQLRQPQVLMTLRKAAENDAVAARHLALLSLVEIAGADVAYAALIDPMEGSKQAMDAFTTGDRDRLALLLATSPLLAHVAFYGPASIAGLALLDDDLTTAQGILRQTLATATHTQRAALAARLRSLATKRPHLTDRITTLLELIDVSRTDPTRD